MNRLHIAADADIPHLHDAFAALGELRPFVGRSVGPAELRDADAVLVRTVTRVGPELLAGSRVRFLGTLSAGTDHVDTRWLARQGITFAHAPGANALAVVDWVRWALARIGEPLAGRTLGVIGCGAVGERVARLGEALGMRVVRNDPPRGEREPGFLPLADALAADLVSVHVPLVLEGPHPTRALVDPRRLRPDAWLLNSARGDVVDPAGLEPARSLLDVWPGEPRVDPALMRAAFAATPHIAGHSANARARVTQAVHEALARFAGLAPSWRLEPHVRVLVPSPQDGTALAQVEAVLEQALALAQAEREWRDAKGDPAEVFHRIRGAYRARPELADFTIDAARLLPETRALLVALGARLA